MALAPTITYTIRDGDNDPATTSVHVPIGDTLQRYGEFAAVHAEVTEAIILGTFDPNAILSVPVDISALTNNTAAAESDVEQIAAFQFANEDNEPVSVNIPGLNVLRDVVIGSDALDETGTEIAAFITMMEDGLTITGAVVVEPCDVAEGDILDHFFARKETKNSGSKR